QTVVTMLACARLGAVHSVVFGGFAPKELAARIDDARPRVLVAASCGIEPTRVVDYKEIVDEALRIADHRPDRVVVLQREQTTVLYEGKPVGTPDAGAFWRVASEHGVSALFTAPTALRAIKRMDPDGVEIGKYDLSAFRALFLAGERLDPETYSWASSKLGVP